jgi:hypothetical protein
MLEAIEDLGRKREESNNKLTGKDSKKEIGQNGERQRLLSQDGAPAS